VLLSESSASDLSLSLTQSDLDEDLPESVASERNATSGASDDDRNQHSPESSHHSDGSKNAPQINCESSAPGVTLERYIVYDFCTLSSGKGEENTNKRLYGNTQSVGFFLTP